MGSNNNIYPLLDGAICPKTLLITGGYNGNRMGDIQGSDSCICNIGYICGDSRMVEI